MVVDGDEDDGGWVEIVCDGGLLHVNVGCPIVYSRVWESLGLREWLKGHLGP